MDKILRVGIAGYGVVGKRRAKCVHNNNELKLIAICDQTFEEDGVTDDGINYYSQYEKLIKQDLDILFVCLTNDVAADATIKGLQKGLHVFCEKPPGRNLEEIASVIEIEKLHPKLKLMYGFNHRFHKSIQDALEIIRSKNLGEIINLRGVYGKSKLITFNQPVWRTKREIAGGGVLLDQGIHMVDLMRLMAGEFNEVNSFVSNNHWGYDVEDNAYALMKTSEGIVAMLHSSATQWRHRFNLEINLQKGSLILGGILSGSKSYGSETLTIINANPDKDNGDPIQEVKSYNQDPSWDDEVKLFVKCISNDEPVTSSSSLDAFQTMKLVNKIYYNDPQWSKVFNIKDPDNINI